MISNIAQAIDKQAQAHLDKVFFDEMGTTHTYRDLLESSNSLAAWLDKEQSVPAGSPIIFYGDHQFEMVAGFIGGIKAGHAYIPVETNTALPRLQSIINTAKPRLVIAIDEFPTEKLDYDGAVLDRFELQQIFDQQTPLKPGL